MKMKDEIFVELKPKERIANKLLMKLLKEIKMDVETYIETLKILEDPRLMKKIKHGLKGRTISFKKFVKKYGLEDEI